MPVKNSPSLPELQKWMRGVIAHPNGASDKLQTSPSKWRSIIQETADLKRDERMDIYGNAYFLRLIECLEANFPSVKNVLGEDDFSELARAYLVKHPSTFRSVEDVGATLAKFISHSPSAQRFPFLSDLAQIEWANQEAFYSDDLPLFDSKKINNIPEEKWRYAKIQLDKSIRLLTLKYLVDALWRDDGTWKRPRLKKIKAQKNHVLVFRRPNHALRVLQITAQQFLLMTLLRQGKTLGQSMQSITKIFPNKPAAIQTWFQEWMKAGVIRDIRFTAR